MSTWCHGRFARWLAAAASAIYVALAAAPAFAGCGDRPGTPVDMSATQSDNRIELNFTNTASEAPIYWDVEVTDGAGHGLPGGAAGISGTRTQATGGAYSQMGRFQLIPIQGGNFKPNTTYCFRVRARTAAGKEGCVSQIWNNPVCVTTPDPSVNQFCSTYARDAINQLNYLRNVKLAGNCGDDGQRWSSDWLGHYNWCIAMRTNAQAAGAPDFERAERNKRLRMCSGYECINSVCKQLRAVGKPKPPTPPPPPPPKPPENQCKYTVWVTNDECVNVDGTPMTSNPAGVMTTFGCGATADEALQRAKAAFHLEQGPQLSDDDSPCPGCCTYTKKVVNSCACPIRTYSKKVEEKKCLRGMIRTAAGSCRCPIGTRWSSGWCRTRGLGTPPATVPGRITPPPPPATCPTTRPVGRPPNCCPVGTVFGDGVCRRPANPITSPFGGGSTTTGGGETGGTCPRSRPAGIYPHCCPKGMIFRGHMCRHDFSRKTTPGAPGGGGGTVIDPGRPGPCPSSRPVGSPPNCCPSGTSFRGGVCRRDSTPTPNPSGGGGTIGTKPNTGDPVGCPRSRPNGSPPNCCPEGTSFTNGACRRPITSPGTTGPTTNPKSCPQGMTGTPPNCCPPGTYFQGGKCIRPTPATPTPTQNPSTAPSTNTTPKSCTGGRIGRPPHCRCPSGTRLLGGRCRRIASPTVPGPAPKKVCPAGLTGPNCDQVIVR